MAMRYVDEMRATIERLPGGFFGDCKTGEAESACAEKTLDRAGEPLGKGSRVERTNGPAGALG